MLRKGHGGLYKAPTKEERRKRAAKRIERYIDLIFERWQVVGLRKARRRQGTKINGVLGGGTQKVHEVAEWLRRSVANLVRSSVLGSSLTVGTILPQANSQLSCPSLRGR